MERRSRNGMLIRTVGGLAALVALQACGASSGTQVAPATGAASSSSPAASSGGGASASATASSSTGTPSATPSTSASPTTGSSATVTPSSSPSTRAGTPECRTADLHVAAGRVNGTAGTFYLPIRFTNAGAHPCELVGFPGVSYLASPGGSQVGDAAERQGAAGSPVVLRPGQTASAIVGMVDVGALPASCRPTSVAGFRVYPPDQTASVFVAHRGTGCAGHIGQPQLTVRAVRPGTGTP